MTPALLAVLIAFAFVIALMGAAAGLIYAVARLLPPLKDFLVGLYEVRAVHADNVRNLAAQPPAPAGTGGWRSGWVATSESVPGVAPPPVDMTSPTAAQMPTRQPGDVDSFEAAAEEESPRPFAPGSRWVQPPPGERIQGET